MNFKINNFEKVYRLSVNRKTFIMINLSNTYLKSRSSKKKITKLLVSFISTKISEFIVCLYQKI